MNKHKLHGIKILVSAFFLIAFCNNSNVTSHTISDKEKTGAVFTFRILNSFLMDEEVLIRSIIVGDTTRVGFISLRNDENKGTLLVRYDITRPGWYITETDIEIINEPYSEYGAPYNNKTNPDLYIVQHDPGISSYEYELPFNPDKNDQIIADVVIERCPADWMAFNELLPAGLTRAFFEKSDYSTYSVDLDIDNNGCPDDFDHKGWCITLKSGNQIKDAQMVKFVSVYQADLKEFKYNNYSLSANIPDVFKPVNWILNQNFVGGPQHPEYGFYTYHDVQAAILQLFNSMTKISRHSDQKRVKFILTQALKYQDYEPGCGENAAVILLPVDSEGNGKGVQPVLISYPVPCLCGD